MTSRVRAWLSWSSGKDSAWALETLRRDPEVEVVGLLTTVNSQAARVAMHGVRRELLEAQARAVGLPLVVVDLPYPCPNEEYEARMAAACERARRDGVGAVAFGDLYLEDVRAYRERALMGTGLQPRFPLWGRDTRELAHAMVAAGVRAILSCVDTRALDASFAGRSFDRELLAELPAGVDPCGENGEFHTFVHSGPMLSGPIEVAVGETVVREGFAFADLVPSAPRNARFGYKMSE